MIAAREATGRLCFGGPNLGACGRAQTGAEILVGMSTDSGRVSDGADNSVDAVRTVVLAGSAAVRGSLSVPGDKSVSHRVLLLAAIAQGTSRVSGLSLGDDGQRTRAGIEQVGVEVEDFGDGALAVTGGIRQGSPGEIAI